MYTVTLSAMGRDWALKAGSYTAAHSLATKLARRHRTDVEVWRGLTRVVTVVKRQTMYHPWYGELNGEDVTAHNERERYAERITTVHGNTDAYPLPKLDRDAANALRYQAKRKGYYRNTSDAVTA